MSGFFGKIKQAFKPHKQPKFKVYESNELKIIAMKTRIILENSLQQLLVTISQQDQKFRFIGQDPKEVYTILQSIGEKVIEAESIKIFVEMMRKVEANSAGIVQTNGDISLMRTEMRWFQCVLWYRKTREVNNLEDLYQFCMNFFKGIDITTELLVKCEVFQLYPILKYLQKGNVLPLAEVLFYVQPYVSFNISQPTLDAVFVINKEEIQQKLEENNPKRMTFTPPSQNKTDYNRNYSNSAIFQVDPPKQPVNPYDQSYNKPGNSGNLQPNSGIYNPNQYNNPYNSSSKINPYQQSPPPSQQNFIQPQPNRNTGYQPIPTPNKSNYNPQDSNARFNNSSSYVPTQNLPNNIDNFGNNPWERPQSNQWNQNIPNQSNQWNNNIPNQSNQWNQNQPNQWNQNIPNQNPNPWQQPNFNNSNINTNPWQNSQAKPNNSQLFNLADQTDHNPFANGNSAFRPKEPQHKEEPKAPEVPKKSFMNSLLQSASKKAKQEEACFILPESGFNVPHNYEREPHQYDPNPNYGSTIPLSRQEQLDRFNTEQQEKKRKQWQQQERKRQREEQMKELALKQEKQRIAAKQVEQKRQKQIQQAKKREQQQQRLRKELLKKRLQQDIKRKELEQKRKEQEEAIRIKQEEKRKERQEEERKEREEEERQREQEERRRARERELMEERDVQIDVFADNEREEIDRGASGRFSMNMGFRTQFGDQNIEQFSEPSPNLMNNSILRFSKDPKTAYKEESPINQAQIDETFSLQIINTADLTKPVPAFKLCYFKKTEA